MNKKTPYMLFVFVGLFTIFGIQMTYLTSKKSMSEEMLNKKLDFVKLTGLPDLAISTEATYIRHRSLTNVFSIYKDDGSLREYFPSTFAISHSHIINKVSYKDEI